MKKKRIVLLVATMALLASGEARAWDHQRAEKYCRSTTKRSDDFKWCMQLEKSGGELFDQAFDNGPGPDLRKGINACLHSKPAGYQLQIECLVTLLQKMPPGSLSDPKFNKLPEFDTINYCLGVSNAIGGSYQVEQTCRETEGAARSRIASSPIDAHILDYCTQVSQAIGGSYTVLETCVDQETKAKGALE